MMGEIREQAQHPESIRAKRPETCEEFQSHLPELVAAGQDVRGHEHLKSCDRCSELLTDLEYIASMANTLLQPVYEPGEAVWQKISASIGKPTEDGSTGHGRLRELPS